MKRLIGTLITAIALMTLPMSGWTEDFDILFKNKPLLNPKEGPIQVIITDKVEKWETINEARCRKGNKEACKALEIMVEIEECSNPKKKEITMIFDKENHQLIFYNKGYDGIIIGGRKLYPCDKLHIDLRYQRDNGWDDHDIGMPNK